jgi:hypothetical protein
MENEKDAVSEEVKAGAAETAVPTEENPLAYAKRKRRLGDRSDGRRLRTIQPMQRLMPYIMPKRSDALNTFYDRIEVSRAEDICRRKANGGMKNFTILHVLLAAYVRTISQRPGINRFISGQKVYSRNSISFIMTVKKDMSLNAPDTSIKVDFEPGDTLDTVYEKFNKVAAEAIASLEHPTSFDKLCKVLNIMPGFLLRFFIWLLRVMDYIGILPKGLLKLSPFHGSMIITSMGSLGINPIYHHIYDFGNLPVFLSYGTKRVVYEYDRKGSLMKHRYIELKAVTDERICDGHYYASAFKYFKKLIENPACLEYPPESLEEDID